MLLGEPAPTPYDLQFRIGPFPVRVHPFFWLVTVIMGINSRDAISIALWVAACFVSILIHELGHAALMRWYGEGARVVLYGMGGLAISDGGSGGPWGYGRRSRRSAWQQIAISFAGPGAGFLFAAALLGLVVVLRGDLMFRMPTLQRWVFWQVSLENVRLLQLFGYLLFINITWGLVNLLPIYPLDGGQIARQLLLLSDPGRGVRHSIIVSIAVGAAMSFLGFAVWHDTYVGIMFALLAVSNYQSLQNGW